MDVGKLGPCFASQPMQMNSHLHSTEFTMFKEERVVSAQVNSDQDRIGNASTIDNSAQDILGRKGSILTETMGVTLQEEKWQSESNGMIREKVVELSVQ